MDKLRVFISSTMEDLKAERLAVVDAINKNRHWEPIYAESFVARSKSPKEVCLEEVRNSDIYIGIFKERYGYIPSLNNPRRLSVVILEYYEAKSNKVPIFLFVKKNENERDCRLMEFIKEITDFDVGHFRLLYSTVDELVRLVIDSIDREITVGYIEYKKQQRETKISNIFKLPYFKRQREKLI